MAKVFSRSALSRLLTTWRNRVLGILGDLLGPLPAGRSRPLAEVRVGKVELRVGHEHVRGALVAGVVLVAGLCLLGLGWFILRPPKDPATLTEPELARLCATSVGKVRNW